MTTSRAPRVALVLSYSVIASDPRVRRQIDWLVRDGWVVDTLGLGDEGAPDTRRHFRLGEPARWAHGRIGALLSHVLLPPRGRFRVQMSDRIPQDVKRNVRAGEYALIIFNELEFAPWIGDARDFTAAALEGHRHLDIHEYHNPSARRRTLGARLTASQYRWGRAHLADDRFTSRSVVNEPIGRLYVEEFGIEMPAVVRNAPPFVADLEPSAVDPDRIRMLFHGMPSFARGFADILEAMRGLPERFTMTFMLMPNPQVTEILQQQIDAHPARDRIRIVPAVPMREIPQHINAYDLEIIFYRPQGKNLEFASPNKFFEAAQGRLAVVVGETATMAPLVREHGHGVVVPQFTAESLRDTLAALTVDDILRMKRAAGRLAAEINAESEGRAFIEAIGEVEQ